MQSVRAIGARERGVTRGQAEGQEEGNRIVSRDSEAGERVRGTHECDEIVRFETVRERERGRGKEEGGAGSRSLARLESSHEPRLLDRTNGHFRVSLSRYS